MTASFFLRQKSFHNLPEGKCLSKCYSFFPNNTACFFPGRAKDLSAPPRVSWFGRLLLTIFLGTALLSQYLT